MRQFSDGQRGVALAAGVGVAWLAFYAAWLAFQPGGADALKIFANTAYLLPIAVATALAVVAARRAGTGLRAFWWLVALSNGFWLAAEFLWSVREFAFGTVPFPWWTDVGYLVSYALLAPALYAAFRPRIRALGAARLLDGALVVTTLALVWAWIVLLPLSLEPRLVSLVGLAYPVFGLVLIGMFVAMRFLPVRHGTLAMRFVAAGVVCTALTDGLYTHAVVTHDYLSGDWIGLGWQAEAVLFSLAAYVSAKGIGRPPTWSRFRDPREIGTGVVITAALLTLIAVLASEVFVEDAHELIAGAVVLAALLTARVWLLFLPRSQTSALRDERTGTYNADYFQDQLTRLAGRAEHFGDPFGLALAEIDGFVPDDDSAVDAQVARRLVRGGRRVDVVARVEPGRLAILLPNVEREEALAVAERMRLEVAGVELRTRAGAVARTISIGVAAWMPDEKAGAVTKRAQAALAAAQRLGGNQVRADADDALLFGDGLLDGERFELLVSLARLVDAREGPDPDHSSTVAQVASAIALEMGLDAATVTRTYIAGLLHDLGKLALPEAMLQKPGPLDEREWSEMVRHSSVGADLVERIGAVRDAAPIVAAHHERWDGTGYPLRLERDRIPAEARIVAVADALVAMTSERPYRSSRSETSALTTIWRDSGKRYDPAVVSALLALAREGRLNLASAETTPVTVGRLRASDRDRAR